MARRRLIIHGSQEELEMFEPIYNTRLRLQHGASTSRFHLPEPPPPSAEYSERPAGDGDHEGAVGNYIQTADDEPGSGGGAAAVEATCWRLGDEENYDSLPDAPQSTTLTEDDQVGVAENNDSTGSLQGDGSEIPSSPCCEAPAQRQTQIRTQTLDSGENIDSAGCVQADAL